MRRFLILLSVAAVVAGCATAPASSASSSQQATPPPSVQTLPGPHPLPEAATQPVLIGTVIKVIDGDTIKVQLSSGPINVRFDSIDAPEHNQPWGPQARDALASQVENREVALDVTTQDRYERLVATVYVGDENINAWMVQQGGAWAYREYLHEPAYCYLEAAARASRTGLWSQSSAHPPWEWRKQKREPTTFPGFNDYSGDTAAKCIAAKGRREEPIPRIAPLPAIPKEPTQPSGCLIKGNIGKNGRIYHVPGSPSYAQTQIDESKGERWFCTEAEARTAGWRAPN